MWIVLLATCHDCDQMKENEMVVHVARQGDGMHISFCQKT